MARIRCASQVVQAVLRTKDRALGARDRAERALESAVHGPGPGAELFVAALGALSLLAAASVLDVRIALVGAPAFLILTLLVPQLPLAPSARVFWSAQGLSVSGLACGRMYAMHAGVADPGFIGISSAAGGATGLAAALAVSLAYARPAAFRTTVVVVSTAIVLAGAWLAAERPLPTCDAGITWWERSDCWLGADAHRVSPARFGGGGFRRNALGSLQPTSVALALTTAVQLLVLAATAARRRRIERSQEGESDGCGLVLLGSGRAVRAVAPAGWVCVRPEGGEPGYRETATDRGAVVATERKSSALARQRVRGDVALAGIFCALVGIAAPRAVLCRCPASCESAPPREGSEPSRRSSRRGRGRRDSLFPAALEPPEWGNW